MADKVSKSKSGGGQKIGRNKDKCARYSKEHRRFKNKIKRVMKSNGPEAARKYEIAYWAVPAGPKQALPLRKE